MLLNRIHSKGIHCLIFLVLIILSGCASHKRVNKQVSQLDCNKTIHFALDIDSKYAKIEYKGEHYGDSPYPNYRRSLQEAVEELDQITSAKLVYKDAIGFPVDSITQVTVKIEKIIWDFRASRIFMEAELTYKLPNREIKLFANNKVYISGTKKGNVFKTLKHGNALFMSVVCEE